MKKTDEEYIELLLNEGFISGRGQIVLRAEGCRPWEGKSGGEESTAEKALREAAGRIFAARENCSAVALSTAPGVAAFSKTGMSLRAVLDDLAQLAGPSVQCLGSLGEVRGKRAEKPALLISGTGCLCAGENLYEAHALAMVAEKAALARIGAETLGKAREITRLESWLMRAIYIAKYSRQGKAHS